MSLNVIGLISGGKDSLYVLAHCLQNGHKIVALANLHPRSNDNSSETEVGEDIDSLMYQTVGHSLVPLYGKALNLPLYRRAISGSAKQDGRYYDTSGLTVDIEAANDEIEDMYMLLQDVLKSHPEANAVSAGAILSTYQRTRVESVTTRLGLVPLAYLWRYPTLPPPPYRQDSLTGLLDDMQSAGCDSRIIKVASGGIRSDLVTMNVAEFAVRSQLLTSLSMFYTEAGQELGVRAAVLGEGGEYETLALSGPRMLWKNCIHVEFGETIEGEGGTMYAIFKQSMLSDDQRVTESKVPLPRDLDLRFAAVQKALAHVERPTTPTKISIPQEYQSDSRALRVSVNFSNTTLQISNLTSTGSTPAAQLRSIITGIPSILHGLTKQHGLSQSILSLHNIVSSTLLLRTMDAFSAVNEVYSEHLWPKGFPNPPARVTMAAPLPQDIHVTLSLVFHLADTKISRHKKGLHVQSRSYWAPANIGPYSQAVSVPISILTSNSSASESNAAQTPLELVHMAGQIPLVPSSMQMLQGTFAEQTTLALQHLWRVGQDRAVDSWVGAGVAFLPRCSEISGTENEGESLDIAGRARIAAKAWSTAHRVDEKGNETHLASNGDDEDSSDVDIWDLRQNYQHHTATPKLTVGDHLHALPNRGLFADSSDRLTEMDLVTGHSAGLSHAQPLFVAAEVSALPRLASIEWHSTGISNLAQAVQQGRCTLKSISTTLDKSWSITGLVISHKEHDEDLQDGDCSVDETQAAIDVGLSNIDSVSNSTCFLTMSAPMDLKKLSVPTLEDLCKCVCARDPSLLKDCSWELVTSSCMMNISLSIETQELLMRSDLAQHTAIYPCYSVWVPRNQIVTNGQREGTADRSDSVEEAAVVFIVRIDSYRRTG